MKITFKTRLSSTSIVNIGGKKNKYPIKHRYIFLNTLTTTVFLYSLSGTMKFFSVKACSSRYSFLSDRPPSKVLVFRKNTTF